MKIYELYEHSWEQGDYNGERSEYYISYDLAKKHFDEKVREIKEHEVFANNISHEDGTSISYSDGYKWSYECGIVQGIDVKEE